MNRSITFGATVLIIVLVTIVAYRTSVTASDGATKPQPQELLPGYQFDDDMYIVETSGSRMHEVLDTLPYLWYKELSQDNNIRSFVTEELQRATEKAHRKMVITFSDREQFWGAEIAEIRKRLWYKIGEEYKLTPIEKVGLDLPALPDPY